MKKRKCFKSRKIGSYTECIQNVYNLDTQYSIDKNSIGKNIISVYEDEIGHLTPNNLTILESYEEDLSEELIIEAIKIASTNGKKNMAYIKAILNNWVSLGIKNVNEIPKKPIKKTKTQQQDFNKVPVGLESLFDN